MAKPHDHEENIRWNGFAASIPGNGHIRRGIPCQDASAVLASPRPAVIVCDGRGSAKLSHFGAQGAVDAFRFQMSIMEPFLVGILDGEEEKPEQWIKFCRIMYRTLMQVKYDLAEKYHEEEREFDCTVAFAIAGEKRIGCFQVGDGSIVMRQNGVCKTVFLPEKGEFANQTHFLRPGGEERTDFQYALLDSEENSGIAITSDGPEHLMFRLTDMTPGKIFDMLFDDLRKEELCRQDLMDYLTRREWADDPRGSDDRSLAVLARIGDVPASAPIPAVEPVGESAEPAAAPEPEVPNLPDKPEVPVEVASDADVPTAPAAEVETETAEAKKKALPCRTLTIVSALAIGLLAETTCLLMQRRAIVRQQQEIRHLNQRIVRGEMQTGTVPPQTLQPPLRRSETAPRKDVETSRLPQPKSAEPAMPKAKEKVIHRTTAAPVGDNTHKEDVHHEKR